MSNHIQDHNRSLEEKPRSLKALGGLNFNIKSKKSHIIKMVKKLMSSENGSRNLKSLTNVKTHHKMNKGKNRLDQ